MQLSNRIASLWKPGKPTILWISIIVFVVLLTIYWLSVPIRFNEIKYNKIFFDSDGEFITRQFRLGITYTHNSHILYHVIAKVFYIFSQDISWSHKIISVVFGAIGIIVLFVGGTLWTGSVSFGLAAALLIGGSAGFWFFSATIDTYVPHIVAASAALVMALFCLRWQQPRMYFALGALIGLAFLFRIDGMLLAPVALVAFDKPERLWPRLGAVCAGGLLIGGAGYIVLADVFYGVQPQDSLSFMFPNRPEVDAGKWAQLSNVTIPATWLTFVNHAAYTVLIPGIEATRSSAPAVEYLRLGAGAALPLVWVALLAVGITYAGALAISDVRMGSRTQSSRERLWLITLSVLWLVPRVVFYTWWDPYDPFLFACMSLPAFWLLALSIYGSTQNGAATSRQNAALAIVAMLAGAVWLHNLLFMIPPLRLAALN